MPELTLRLSDPLSAEAIEILGALDADLQARYPCGSIHGFDPDDIAKHGLLLLAREGDQVVGCGALRPYDDSVAEIKRMFVSSAFRGRGYSRAILAKLEAEAASLGFSVLRLEAGGKQPEALGLYESSGYRPIEPFGEYVGDPLSLCYEKRL